MQDKLELVLCPGYEHMDTLWGENVYQDVFKPVLERLENWNSLLVIILMVVITEIQNC